jgi:hypothetical protein
MQSASNLGSCDWSPSVRPSVRHHDRDHSFTWSVKQERRVEPCCLFYLPVSCRVVNGESHLRNVGPPQVVNGVDCNVTTSIVVIEIVA